MLQSCFGHLQTCRNSEFSCTAVISSSHLFWKPLPGRREAPRAQTELKSVLPVGSSSATSGLVWWQLLSVTLQSCPLRLPLAPGRLGHMRDLTLVPVGFNGMKIFFVERDLLTLIFIVSGAEEHLSTSSVNRVFCVWVRGRIPAAS